MVKYFDDIDARIEIMRTNIRDLINYDVFRHLLIENGRCRTKVILRTNGVFVD